MLNLNKDNLTYAEIQELHRIFVKKCEGNPEILTQDIPFIRNLAEKWVYCQLLRFAVLQYTQMQRSGDFGITGEENVTNSFCRLLLKIPPEKELTLSDLEEFRRRIREYQTDNLTDEELDKTVAEYRLFLMGRYYGGGTRDQINAVLKSLGSEKMIFCSFKQGKRNIIFGKGRTEQKGSHVFYTFDSEDMRSPYSDISVIASTSENNIAVRRESAEMIFQHKWLRKPEYAFSPEMKTAEKLKQAALKAYRVKNPDDLRKQKSLFVEEIMEGVLWHETGHTVISDNVLSPDAYALSKSFYSLGFVPVRVFNELLADWAPEQADGRTGPICQLIGISEENREKAERMLRVYLSDNWFYGNGSSPVLCRQTDFLFSVLMPFIRKDAVDFSRLAREYERLFSKMMGIYEEMLNRLTAPVKDAVFVMKGERMSFEEADRKLREVLEHPICKKEWSKNESRDYPMFYYSNLINWTQQYSPDTFVEMVRRSEELTEWAGRMVLKLVTGSGAEGYPDMIQYIENKMEIF